MQAKWTSRREFIAGASVAAVAALLAGCGSDADSAILGQSNFDPVSPVDGVYDAIVVGSGAAGIAAGRAVQSARRSVLVLEAQDHIGGRCRTDNSFPVPYDYGAQFMGQAQSLNNILFPLAQQLGINMVPSEQVAAQLYDPATGLPADPLQLADFVATFAQVTTAIQTAGPAVALGAPDISIAQLLQDTGLQNAPFIELVLQFVMEVIDGGSAATQSLLDLYNVVQFIPITFVFPQRDSLFVPSGFGNFLARLATGLTIVKNAPVTVIDTSGANVLVTAGGQRYTARTVVVTASVNVLKAGAITFTPALPASHTTALSQVTMGHAYKAMLEFTPNPFNGKLGATNGQTLQTFALKNDNSTAFFVNYFAEFFTTANTYVMAICEAERALELEALSPAAQGASLCAELEIPFPGVTSKWTGRILSSNWATNPYTRGCISYCTPGNAGARERLQQSVGNKLWLAGEAITVHAHSLVHGAWASGQHAALAAMAAIGALG